MNSVYQCLFRCTGIAKLLSNRTNDGCMSKIMAGIYHDFSAHSNKIGCKEKTHIDHPYYCPLYFETVGKAEFNGEEENGK